jgi:hypothetical protein
MGGGRESRVEVLERVLTKSVKNPLYLEKINTPAHDPKNTLIPSRTIYFKGGESVEESKYRISMNFITANKTVIKHATTNSFSIIYTIGLIN